MRAEVEIGIRLAPPAFATAYHELASGMDYEPEPASTLRG